MKTMIHHRNTPAASPSTELSLGPATLRVPFSATA